jgi:hypothetical protein
MAAQGRLVMAFKRINLEMDNQFGRATMGRAVKFLIAVFAICCYAYAAKAQERVPYKEKSVWTMSYFKTKPGQFDAYLDELSKLMPKYMDQLKADGHVLSYKILRVEFPRDNEPNLIILIEYKSMADLDPGMEYFERLTKQFFGSIDNSSKIAVEREQLRKTRGAVLARELDFVQ